MPNRFVMALTACALAVPAWGQAFEAAAFLPAGEAAAAGLARPGPGAPSVAQGAVIRVNLDELAAILDKAPRERAARLKDYGLPLRLVGPEGEDVECLVAESPVMEPPLAAKFPDLRMFIVQTADGRASGRLEVTPRGVTAMLRSADGVWMIDLWRPGDPTLAVSYNTRDLRVEAVEGAGAWACETVEGPHGSGVHVHEPWNVDLRGPGGSTGGEVVVRRTVRLALACTGEYGRHQCQLLGHEPNVADALAAVVTTVSRVNVVYEADMGVRFNLVADNDRLIHVDPATDPYPDTCDGLGGSDCSQPYLTVNTSVINQAIGSSRYDVGHLLTRVYGGVAFLSSVCGNSKGGGISGIPRGGDVDALAYLVAVHELGHQFGATHTFGGVRGRCANNATGSSAWEAGSGSSPMAYPGACPVGDAPPSDNVATFADPFFHLGSIEQMRTFISSRLCPVQEPTANHAPVVAAGGSWFIPPSTPFRLETQATDADGDTLIYSWEQFDPFGLRPLTGTGSHDTGAGALFRIFPPVASPARTFPRMADVLSGVATPGERLPTFPSAQRRFRVIVRDQSPGAGGAALSAPAMLTVAPNAAPFTVTQPPAAAGQPLPPGTATVRWTVGGTNLPPISCASVGIDLSSDGGQTFPVDLGTFPNTGEAEVRLPGGVTDGRVRISAVGNVFFAVSGPFATEYCRADINRSGEVTLEDLFAFLAAYFEHAGAGDFNGDEAVSVQDVFDFLVAYFAPCG